MTEVHEKLVIYGRHTMTNAEIVQSIIGIDAVPLMESVENNITLLAKMDMRQMCRIPGMTKRKAALLIAAIELGRRWHLSESQYRPKIRGSKDAFNILSVIIGDLPHEEFWILALNRANNVIARELISSGGMAETVVDPKVIFRKAIELKTSGIIMAHNHPSGEIRPSQADIDLTRKLREGGALLDIVILDHLIIGDRSYYSFADEGMI